MHGNNPAGVASVHVDERGWDGAKIKKIKKSS
jgi:hypothetical protein